MERRGGKKKNRQERRGVEANSLAALHVLAGVGLAAPWSHKCAELCPLVADVGVKTVRLEEKLDLSPVLTG